MASVRTTFCLPRRKNSFKCRVLQLALMQYINATIVVEPPKGQFVQAVSRAMVLLKLLASSNTEGLSAQVLAQISGLNRSTVIRLLSCLVQTGYVQHRAEIGLYRPALSTMQLGLTAMNRSPVVEHCRPLMQSIARMTEDTVFLVVRNGDCAHCLHLEAGAFPVRTITLLVGSFRLMSQGTAGRALLATLNDSELVDLYQRHKAEYERKGISASKLREMVQRTRLDRYSTGLGLVTKGVNAIGVPFEVIPGYYAALSVGAIAARMNEKRRPEVAQVVKDTLEKWGFTPFL